MIITDKPLAQCCFTAESASQTVCHCVNVAMVFRSATQWLNISLCLRQNPFKSVFTSLSLSSPSITSRELLSQFSTCGEWRCLKVGNKWKKDSIIFKTVPRTCRSKSTTGCRKLGIFSEMQDNGLMHEIIKS